MNKDDFWRIIERCRAKAGTDDMRFLEAIKAELREHSIEDLGKFQGIMNEYLDAAYMPGLWAAGKIINIFCDENRFIDFRAWLISCGKDIYLSALVSPDSLAATSTTGRCEFEDFSYVADMVYKERTEQYFLPAEFCELDETMLEDIHAEINYGPGVDVMYDDETVRGFFPKLIAQKFGGEDFTPYWMAWPQNAAEIARGSRYRRIRAAEIADDSESEK